MSWLLTHMWVALGAVGLFGILFGWSVRGIMLVGKLRTARVDRDVAKTELEQARAEIEGLYAAQRNTAPGAADPHLRAELNVREKRMAELSAELTRSKAELQALRSGAGRSAVVAPVPVAAKAGSSTDQEEPSLLWRNRHLEGRVRHLEAALHQGSLTGSVEALAAPAAVAGEPAGDAVATDKLNWQVDFLKQRVEALEAELTAPAPVAVSAPLPEAGGDPSEELARLRWRNRFLEGRVAYFEGEGASPADDAVSEADAIETADDASLISASDAILSELEEVDAAADAEEAEFAIDQEVDEEEEADEAFEEQSDDDALDDDDAGEFDDAEEDDDEAEYEVDEDALVDAEDADDEESDDVESDDDEEIDDDEEYGEEEDGELDDEDEDEDEEAAEDDEVEEGNEATVETERPIALEKPVADSPDNLTIIGGIGPKIQEVLNELGIYHYDQIAAWTPENIAWVDNHLNFSGRISREGWVEQAAILSGDVTDE